MVAAVVAAAATAEDKPGGTPPRSMPPPPQMPPQTSWRGGLRTRHRCRWRRRTDASAPRPSQLSASSLEAPATADVVVAFVPSRVDCCICSFTSWQSPTYSPSRRTPLRTSKPLPSAGDAFADVAAPLRPEVTGDVVSTAKNVAAASGEEDAVAYRNLARGNRRASRGRTRTRRCSPRARSKPVSGWDGNNTAAPVGLTFDFVFETHTQQRPWRQRRSSTGSWGPTRYRRSPKGPEVRSRRRDRGDRRPGWPRRPRWPLLPLSLDVASHHLPSGFVPHAPQPRRTRLRWYQRPNDDRLRDCATSLGTGGGEGRRGDPRNHHRLKYQARCYGVPPAGEWFVLSDPRELGARPGTELKLRSRASSPLGWQSTVPAWRYHGSGGSGQL